MSNKKEVFYKGISIEGFQSIAKPITFNLNRPGINVIKGTNGTGKSTIFNALLWAEYKTNLKKSLATWEDRRPAGWRGTRVAVTRSDGEFDYMIVRHEAFKGETMGLQGGDKLMIFMKPVAVKKFDGTHLVGSALNKAEMQDKITEQLGVDGETFLNSIMFGQRMKSLAEVDNKEKRDLFDRLFDVEFVEIGKANAKLEKERLTTNISNTTTKMESSETIIVNASEVITEYEELQKTFDQKKKDDLEAKQLELKEKEAELHKNSEQKAVVDKKLKKYDFDKLKSAEGAADEAANSYRNATNNVSDWQRSVKDLGTEITASQNKEKKYNEDLAGIKDTCPTCGENMKDKKAVDNAKKLVKDNIKKEQDVQKVLNGKLLAAQKEEKTALATQLETQGIKDLAAEQVANIKAALAQADPLKADLEKLKEADTRLTTEVQGLLKEVSTISGREMETMDIKKYQKQKDDNEKLLLELGDTLAKDKKRLELVDWWVSKGFAAGGLKSFVFNAMLAGLNQYAKKYAARLGFRVEFSIDLTKASKPFRMLIYSDNEVRDYEDLSGGQKQRVDVCIAFAMHDLISFKTNINILLMDEIFEGLDNEGVEAAFDLIAQKAETHSVYVITHNDVVDGLNCKYIDVSFDEDKNTVIE